MPTCNKHSIKKAWGENTHGVRKLTPKDQTKTTQEELETITSSFGSGSSGLYSKLRGPIKKTFI
jgi:hypothetical protein